MEKTTNIIHTKVVECEHSGCPIMDTLAQIGLDFLMFNCLDFIHPNSKTPTPHQHITKKIKNLGKNTIPKSKSWKQFLHMTMFPKSLIPTQKWQQQIRNKFSQNHTSQLKISKQQIKNSFWWK